MVQSPSIIWASKYVRQALLRQVGSLSANMGAKGKAHLKFKEFHMKQSLKMCCAALFMLSMLSLASCNRWCDSFCDPCGWDSCGPCDGGGCGPCGPVGPNCGPCGPVGSGCGPCGPVGPGCGPSAGCGPCNPTPACTPGSSNYMPCCPPAQCQPCPPKCPTRCP